MINTDRAEGNRPKIIIETPSLVLRGAVIADVDDLFECFSDDEVLRYWDTPPHATPAVTQTWVENMIKGSNNGITDFVICLKQDTNKDRTTVSMTHPDQHQGSDEKQSSLRVIGKVGIWHGSEIGFLLNRSYWGRGFAIQAVSAVLDLAFDIPPPSRTRIDIEKYGSTDTSRDGLLDRKPALREDVVADVDPRNAGSLGLLKKLGFRIYATKEKTFQVGDEWVDSVYLSLERTLWVRKRDELDAKRLTG